MLIFVIALPTFLMVVSMHSLFMLFGGHMARGTPSTASATRSSTATSGTAEAAARADKQRQLTSLNNELAVLQQEVDRIEAAHQSDMAVIVAAKKIAPVAPAGNRRYMNLRGVNTGPLRWALVTTLACDKFSDVQQAAIESWLRLDPAPFVMLVADCIPAPLRGKVELLPPGDTSFDGLPMFNGMMFRTLQAASRQKLAVVGWVNADILLASDVGETINLAFRQHKHPWLLLGTRHNIPRAKLYRTAPKDLRDYIQANGKPHRTGGVDLFVWNEPHKPIVRGPFPPFFRTANIWDNWWVAEAAVSRLIVDGGAAMTIGHIEHVRYDSTGKEVVPEKLRGEQLSPWTTSKYTDWHNFHNRAVLIDYQRGYARGVGTAQSVPVEIVITASVQIDFVINTEPKPSIVGHSRIGVYTDHRMASFRPEPSRIEAKSRAFGIPHTLESLLTKVDPTRPALVTAAASPAHVPLVLSWVCNLQTLGLYTNVLIAVFDEESYTKLYHHGHPVYLAAGVAVAPTLSAGALAEARKTAVALQVLRAGRSMVWCDPDVAVHGPFLPWMTKSSGDMYIMSNVPPGASVPLPGQPKVNGGLYFARPKAWVIEGLGAVQRMQQHAVSTSAGQAAFEAVLCPQLSGGVCSLQAQGRDAATGAMSLFRSVGVPTVALLPNKLFALGAAALGFGHEWDLGKPVNGAEEPFWPAAVNQTRPLRGMLTWKNEWVTDWARAPVDVANAQVARASQLGWLWYDLRYGHCATGEEQAEIQHFLRPKHRHRYRKKLRRRRVVTGQRK